MAKRSCSSDTKSNAAYAKARSTLTDSELSLVNSELESSLRRAAVLFVAELKDKFAPHSKRADSRSATESADKFVRLRQEHPDNKNPDALYSDRQIRGLFHAPSMFKEGTWYALKPEERLRVITTGLKVAGHVIIDRYRADLLPRVRKVRQPQNVKNTETLDNYDEVERIPPRRETAPSTPNVSPTPPVSVGDPRDLSSEPEGSPSETAPAAHTRAQRPMHKTASTSALSRASLSLRPAPFNLDVLKLKLELIPWDDQRMSAGFGKNDSVETLLDLVNLSVKELSSTLNAFGCKLEQLQKALKVVTNSKDESYGKALALIFSPLGKVAGGLGLSADSVEQLGAIYVPRLKWEADELVPEGNKAIAIDNGWRLLRHYNPKIDTILTPQELQSVQRLFKGAGFWPSEASH